MVRKNAVRLISFCTAAVLVFAGIALKSRKELKKARLNIQNSYSQSFNELNTELNNIHLILQKAEYATSSKLLGGMAAELLVAAENAKNALSRLPTGEEELTVINRFLSHVGNYAMAVSTGLGKDEKKDEEFAENVNRLKKAAEKLVSSFDELSAELNNTEARLDVLAASLGDSDVENSLATSLYELENGFTDYPTLVYDGPYSDHILEKEPIMLENAAEVSENEARETAAVLMDAKPDSLHTAERVEGKIPAYRFSCNSGSVSVSVRGGFPVNMRKTRNVADNTLDYDTARVKAEAYLEKVGFSGLEATYYFTDEGVCVISYAYRDGKTLCYTDLVKVGVATDNGEIMLLEAAGFIANHTERAFETPTVELEAASLAVSNRLKIRRTDLALIPTSGAGETRCYEFLCEAEDGGEVLVYINAVTGEEEEILILLKSDGGTLVK